MKMTEKAIEFAAHCDMYCQADEKCIKVKYDNDTRSWGPAVDTLLTSMSEDAFLHQFITGDNDDVIRYKIEIVLCRAAEREDDQPTIFPLTA